MKAALQAELLKLRSTKTGFGLLVGMLALVCLAVLLHGFGLDAGQLLSKPNQIRVLIAGESVGVVFAALLGALSVTSEFRHGTIRPTFLAMPNRRLVVAAKALVSALVGSAFGALAATAAVGVGQLAFAVRDIPSALTTGDMLQLVVGGAVASGLWGATGLGLGSLVRNQVAAVVGIFVWLQIVENLLIDSVPKVSQYMPAALGQALAGSQVGVLTSALAAFLLLFLYTAAVVSAGAVGAARADIT